ncbi:unnamed protein product [Darwinula stevensoni]|uniref:Carboxylesterase type B domain-containing protein n=1 Tax=Darwinula stevensoni TaxID=69355 RepID=A0A7R8X6I9_9CRUS|nr:unnamed protein product [Darwinula stevensoni]CAG0888223.1 unnamed protein product [Darwinula stevensoni]
MDEDCLYLNIYTPSTSGAVSVKYPVVVYIHGGNFDHGSSNTFPPHVLVGWHEVVVVTINYRLGALGFLSTGDQNSPGNYGLLDQALAIRWVYENIHSFNGDPHVITLYGPGAGGASAGLQMIAPRTRDYVRRVFAQSGSMMADWGALWEVERAKNTSRVYGERIGCNTDNSYKLVECLIKGRSYGEIANQEIEPDLGLFPWAPVVDGEIRVSTGSPDFASADWHILPEKPELMIEDRLYRARAYMTGVTRDEASYLLYHNKSHAPVYDIGQDFVDMKIREYVHKYNYTLNPQGVFEAIRYMYTYWPDPSNRTHIREEYIKMMSDALYRAPVDHAVKMLVPDSRIDVYMYVLNTTIEALKLPYWRQIPHNLEYYYFTGAPFMDKEFFPENDRVERIAWTELDRNMSQLFLYSFANFARYGRPTPEQIFDINWEKAEVGDLKYLSVNNTFNTTMLRNYQQQQCAFWSEYIPLVVGRLIPTLEPTTEFWWEAEGPIQVAFWSTAGVAVLLLILVFICCCLWCGARRHLAKVHKEYADSAFFPSVEENFHAFATPSTIPATPQMDKKENGKPLLAARPRSEVVENPYIFSKSSDELNKPYRERYVNGVAHSKSSDKLDGDVGIPMVKPTKQFSKSETILASSSPKVPVGAVPIPTIPAKPHPSAIRPLVTSTTKPPDLYREQRGLSRGQEEVETQPLRGTRYELSSSYSPQESTSETLSSMRDSQRYTDSDTLPMTKKVASGQPYDTYASEGMDQDLKRTDSSDTQSQGSWKRYLESSC